MVPISEPRRRKAAAARVLARQASSEDMFASRTNSASSSCIDSPRHDVQYADVRARQDAHARCAHFTQVAPDGLLESSVEQAPFGSLFGELLSPLGAEIRRQHPLAARRPLRFGDPALQRLVVWCAEAFEHDQRRHHRHAASRQTGKERAAVEAGTVVERRIESVLDRGLAGREDLVERDGWTCPVRGRPCRFAAAPIARYVSWSVVVRIFR